MKRIIATVLMTVIALVISAQDIQGGEGQLFLCPLTGQQISTDCTFFGFSCINVTAPPCSYSRGGIITLSNGSCNSTNPYAGEPPYSVYLNDTLVVTGNTPTFTNVAPGTYEIYTQCISDANGCVDVQNDIFVTVPAATSGDTLFYYPTNPTCANHEGGELIITDSSSLGPPPYTFSWSTGAQGYKISNLSAGPYTLTVTNGNGCTYSYDLSLTLENAPPDYTLYYTDPICTATNGGYYVQMTSGAPPYSFRWSNGNSDSVINNLAPGSYSVTVTDANNCSATGSWVLANNDVTLDVSVTTQNDGCNNQQDGYVAANVTNANGNVNYIWDNGSTNFWTGNVGPGTYSVQVSDEDGCTGEASGEVKASDPITVSYSITPETCYELNDGIITIDAYGGDGNYSYNWSPVGAGSESTGLFPDDYSITVTDDNGCSGSVSATLQPTPQIIIAQEGFNFSCNQSNTFWEVQFTGGTPPLNYAWTDGGRVPINVVGAGNEITGLQPNLVYTVIVEDQNGCSTTYGVSYTPPPPYHTSFNASICAGQSYEYNGHAYTTAGSYPVTLTAQNGCDSIVTLNLVVSPLVTPSIGITGNNALCNGGSTTFNASVNNAGNSPVYQWQVNGVNAGNNSSTFTSAALTNGATVKCILTSNASCLSTTTAASNIETITVGNSVTPAITIGGNSILCAGQTDTFTAIASGGGNQPAYQWKVNGNNAGTNSNIFTSSAITTGSTVTCVLTSNATCATTSSANANTITVTVKPSPVANAGAGGAFCYGGSLALGGNPTASGGTSPYSYNWGPPIGLNSTTTANPVTTSAASTRYSVTVTDASGCQTTASDSVTVNALPLTPSLTSNSPVSAGDTIKLTAGALTGATYQWHGPNGFSSTLQNPVISHATAAMSGAYSLVVTSSTGCASVPDTLIVTVNDITVNGIITAVDCNGDNDGSIALTISGGTAPYTFAWSNGATTQNINELSAGIYSVFITDAAGRTATQIFTVSQPALLASAGFSQSTCSTSATGAVQVTTFGGIEPYTYTWSNFNNGDSLGAGSVGIGDSIFEISHLPKGDYLIKITDANGCQSESLYIIDTMQPAVSVSANPTSVCAGTTINFAAVPVNAGINPIYQWFVNGNLVASDTVSSAWVNGLQLWYINSVPLPPYTFPDTIWYSASNLRNNDTIWLNLVTSAACNGVVSSNKLIVDIGPVALVNPVKDQVVCSGQTSLPVNFSGTATTYKWTNSNPSIGLAESGTGNIPAFTAVDTGSGPIKAIITVTPLSGSEQSCTVNAVTFSITVNPVPTIQVLGATEFCAGSQAPWIHFSSGVPYATYSWTNNNTAIGLPASGTGSIPAFTATDPIQAIDSAVITVTETAPPVAYITNNGYGNVFAINATTNAVLDTIAVGSQPSGLAVSPNGQRVYVTNYAGGNVSVIDAAAHAVIATVNTGNTPYAVVVSPDNSKVYVANTGSGNIAVIDAVANTVLGAYPINASPQSLAISPDGNIIYATFPGPDALGVLNTVSSIFTPVYVGQSPDGMAISPDGSKLYIACNNSNAVSVVSTSSLSVIDSVPVGNTPRAVCISPDGSRAYVSNANSDNVTVINTAHDSVVATISVGSHPWGLCVTPDGSKLFVNNSSGNSVSVINTSTNTVSATLTGYSFPQSYCNQFISGNNCGASKSFTIKVKPVISTAINQAICQGQAYAGHSTGGTYIDTLTAANGCDSIVTLTLTVLPVARVALGKTICAGQSYQGHNTSGIYIDTLTGSNGCDSIVTLYLQVASTLHSSYNQVICSGNSFDGYSATGTYIDTFQSSGGCDSIRTLYLTVSSSIYTGTVALVCPGSSYDGHHATGTYTDTFTSATGCDSIRTLYLTVQSTIQTDITKSICAGSSYNGYSASGIYIDTFTATGGCDSIRVLSLTVQQVIRTGQSVTLCPGSSYHGYSTAGSYIDTFTAAGGCDSINTLVISLGQAPVTNLTGHICPGSTYHFNGNIFTQPGTYRDTLISANGCDSVLVLNLASADTFSVTLTDTIFEGRTFNFHGQQLTATGTYADTLLSANGCDSITHLQLVVIPFDSTVNTGQSNESLHASQHGDSYQWIYCPSGQPIAGADSQSYTPSSSGSYACIVTVGTSADTTICYSFTVGINELVIDNIRVYPNPTNDVINIYTTGTETLTAALSDVSGKIILERVTFTGSIKTLDLSAYSAGVYVLSITSKESQRLVKIVKE